VNFVERGTTKKSNFIHGAITFGDCTFAVRVSALLMSSGACAIIQAPAKTTALPDYSFTDQQQEGAMSQGLDVIIVDDDSDVLEITAGIVNRFYTWGNIFVFSDVDEALEYCRLRNSSIAVFVVDVFLRDRTGFVFLDALADKFPAIYEDTVMITGDASDEVVHTCVASGIHHLLEKPVRVYALQLAVRAIVSKYLNFSRRLLHTPELAEWVAGLESG
jgi:FixJ family two-component response regulator